MNDGWIEWSGGECPVGDGERVQVRFEDGWVSGESFVPTALRWNRSGKDSDIVAYRIFAPANDNHPQEDAFMAPQQSGGCPPIRPTSRPQSPTKPSAS